MTALRIQRWAVMLMAFEIKYRKTVDHVHGYAFTPSSFNRRKGLIRTRNHVSDIQKYSKSDKTVREVYNDVKNS